MEIDPGLAFARRATSRVMGLEYGGIKDGQLLSTGKLNGNFDNRQLQADIHVVFQAGEVVVQAKPINGSTHAGREVSVFEPIPQAEVSEANSHPDELTQREIEHRLHSAIKIALGLSCSDGTIELF